MKYIAYGSNMSLKQMKVRCPGARYIGAGWLEDARLEYYRHATVESAPGQSVPAAVWEIGPAEEALLDEYEDYPGYYLKTTMAVCMPDGSRIEGMVYVMRRIEPVMPGEAYVAGIEDAYRELGFGTEVAAVLDPALERARARSSEKAQAHAKEEYRE